VTTIMAVLFILHPVNYLARVARPFPLRCPTPAVDVAYIETLLWLDEPTVTYIAQGRIYVFHKWALVVCTMPDGKITSVSRLEAPVQRK
jgi:hypothetical protein